MENAYVDENSLFTALKKMKPLNGKKKRSFWSNMVRVGGKADVFVLSIKQHKTVLGKESPIDHINS